MRKYWRRLVLAGAVLGVVGVGVIPLPSYVVRWKVLPRLEQSLQGRVVVGDWSAGWLSGVTFRDVRVSDAGGQEILAADSIYTPFSALKSLTGHYDLGKSTAKGTHFHLIIRADGTTNFDSLFTPSTAPLNLTADVDAEVTQGTVDLPGGVSLPISGGQVALLLDTAGAKPMSNKVALQTADGGRISLVGESASQTIEVENVAIRTAALASKVSGQFQYTADTRQGSTIRGMLRSEELSFVTRDETVRLRKVSLPVDITSQPNGRIAIANLSLESAEGKISVGGEFAAGSVMNLLRGRPPGEAGKVHATVTVSDMAAIVGQLPHALNLAKDARVTGGQLGQEVDVAWSAGEVTVASKGDFAAAGQNAGREVAIAPITLSVSGKAKPVADSTPELTSLSATVNSAFMTLDAKADSLTSVRAAGSVSLGKLVEQAGQFVDLGQLSAAGSGTFEVQTAGTIGDPSRPLTVRSAVTLEGVKVSKGGAGRALVDEPHLSLTALAKVDMGRPGVLDRIREFDVHLQSRSGTVDAKGPSLAELSLNADLDLAAVREQVGTVVDLGMVQTSGRAKVSATTSGNVGKADAPVSAKVSASVGSFSLGGVPNVGVIENTSLACDLAVTVARDAGGGVAGLVDSAVTFSLGEAADPVVAVKAGGDLDLRGLTSKRFEITQLSADLPRFLKAFPTLAAALPVQVLRGHLEGTGAGAWDGGKLTLAGPAKVRVSDLTAGPAGVSEEGMPVRGETLTVSAGGEVGLAPALSGSVSTLVVTSSSHLLDLALGGTTPLTWGGAGVAGDVTFSADVGRLSRLAWPVAALGGQARVDGVASLNGGAGRPQGVIADLRFTHVTVPPYFADAGIHFVTKGSVAAAGVDFTGAIETPLGSAKVDGGRYALRSSDGRPTAGWLDGLTHVELAADVPNFAALYAAVAPGSPVTVGSGKLTTRATVSREGRTTTARLSDFKVAGLSMRAGQQPVAEGDLTLAANVAVDSNGSGEPAAVRVSDLKASLGVAEVTLPEPVVVTELALPQPTVAGVVRATGRLDPAWKIGAAFLGLPATTTAGGEYVMTQRLSTTAGKLHLVGDVAATNVRLAQGEQTLLSEPTAQVAYDLEVDRSTRTVAANVLKVTTASGAASVQAVGRVLDWQGTKQLDGVHVDVDYDLEKLWPALQPWLAPEYRVAELKLAGQHRAGFEVRGNVPGVADSALRTMAISGTVSVASADYGTYSVRDLTVPVVIQNGTLRTVYPDGRAATPAKFNGGTLDVSEVTLDLSGPTARVTLPRNKVVLANVKVDVALANDLLGRVCPLFVGTREADGRLTLAVVDCTNLDPNELMNAGASMRGQRLELLMNASDLRVASMLTDALGPLVEPGALAAIGGIRDGHVVVQDGQAIDDLAVQLVPQGFEVGMRGTVRLTDRTLMPLTVTLSKKMVPAVRNAGPAAEGNLPEKLELPIDGTADHPQPRVDALTRAIQEAAAKGQVGGK